MTSGPVSRDRLGRPLGSLRISVTDRCNLRCSYCMPEDSYIWLPRASILTFEELERLAGVFVRLGATKIRLTGGEPLLRHDLPDLVARVARIPGVADLAMTTNALLLSRFAGALRRAGLRRVTVSLDTLRPERYRDMTRADRMPEALAGIEAAQAEGFADLKLNAVVVRGVNDDELFDLLEFGRAQGMEVRFIEYMDVGGATRWADRLVVPRVEMLERIAARYGKVLPSADRDPAAPAERFRLPDGTPFGIIASTTEPFCRTCDRSRLTADGMWFLCLYAAEGVSLRDRLRAGATDEELAQLIQQGWAARTDRGAEERVATTDRGALYQVDGLRRDPHREMHTRGG
ncbi:MAG TPA: GTP 3',8-cyclase MoaA [Gemmatimonadales bacterium]